MIHPDPNWLQRRYFTWAQPHYDRLEPVLREEVQRIDLWLYSRRSLPMWLTLVALMVLTVATLRAAQATWFESLLFGVMLWLMAAALLLRAWIKPTDAEPQRMVWRGGLAFITVFVVLPAVQFVASAMQHGDWSLGQLSMVYGRTITTATLLFFVVLSVLIAAQLVVALVRRQQLALRLAHTQQAQALAEARLHALQTQIQPHFVFNTLATVQHWVDSGDARASGLLRDLTAFLRGATELFARPQVALADEAAWVGHYLAVQQARLGARMRSRVTVAPDAASCLLPPGLLLTLVENAIEHGIAPTLAGGEVVVHAACTAGALNLTVTDSGAGLPAGGEPQGTGLANTRARLASAFGARARLTLSARPQGGTEARITIKVTP